MASFDRKIAMISEDITVKEFEDENNALVHMVFDGVKMCFPSDDLNLKEMCVTYDSYQ